MVKRDIKIEFKNCHHAVRMNIIWIYRHYYFEILNANFKVNSLEVTFVLK